MQDANIALIDPIRNSEFITRKVVPVALGTLFLAASSWISIPTVPIPITMQTYAVIVVGSPFGARLGVITVLAWLAEAAIGLPVLAHGASGLAPFVGRSGTHRQKGAIRSAFSEADRPLSLEEALAAAQQHHRGLGIATVYRNIKALLEDRWLITVEIPGEPPRYEISGKQHHHHFHCNDCGKLCELEGCVDRIKTRLPRGFHATGHEFFLYGICASCTPKRKRAPA